MVFAKLNSTVKFWKSLMLVVSLLMKAGLGTDEISDEPVGVRHPNDLSFRRNWAPTCPEFVLKSLVHLLCPVTFK